MAVSAHSLYPCLQSFCISFGAQGAVLAALMQKQPLFPLWHVCSLLNLFAQTFYVSFQALGGTMTEHSCQRNTFSAATARSAHFLYLFAHSF